MMGVPTFYTRLLANPGFTRELASGLRLFICGSAPLLPSTFAEFEERTGQRILERYGMSEAVIITTNPLAGGRVAGSVGYPLPGVDLRIGGDGQTGVIEIKGPSVFSAYWRMPEKTAEEFTADGFFITGDVGRRDPDGRVWISGRAKDLIISGGYNIYPKEVELVFDELPGVTETAVVGVPHPDFGEAVVAVVMGQGDEAALNQLIPLVHDELRRIARRCMAGERAGHIGDGEVEPHLAARFDQAPLDDVGDQVEVDVAARDDHAHPLAEDGGELLLHDGGNAHRAGALGDRLLHVAEQGHGLLEKGLLE
jgi:acyl-CoA synthetase (AMP-forming)/AMP-acid ligase II